MDLAAISGCVMSMSCVVTQSTSGLIIGMLVFLIASGLTLIFGVLNVVNFAHGSFYMLGAYAAYSVFLATGSYTLAILGAAIAVTAFGVVFERVFMSRVYQSDILLQLLVCYAFILILDDAVKLIWGADFLAMGMPATFRLPPIRFAGGIVPPFYLFLIGVSVAIAIALWYIIERTRFGKTVRAAAVNKDMVSALGIRTPFLYAALFGLGSMLAGAAGGLAVPVRSLSPGMGFSILIESFIVTVIGGMGSIFGAFVASVLLGLTRSFGSLGFPQFVDGIMFLMMALVLIFKPSGLFGLRRR